MPVMTFPRPRMDDIDECESPYLDGLFDKLIESGTFSFISENLEGNNFRNQW